MGLSSEVESRYWSRVAVNAYGGCWSWSSYRNHEGYSAFAIKKKKHLAHRVSWEIHNGPIPPGIHVCHHCDNPECSNPDHLFLGDDKDNGQDASRKRRTAPQRRPEVYRGRVMSRPGERNPNSKLTPEQVGDIRSGSGSSYALARKYGVHASTIQRIRNGVRWKT